MRGVGSFVVIFLNKYFSRRLMIFISLIFMFAFCILSLFLNFFTFFIFTFFANFFSGVADPLIQDNLCELLPTKFRGFFMSFQTISSPLSQVTNSLILKSLNSENNQDSLFKIQIIISCILFIFSLISIFLYEDSPKYLILKEDIEPAMIYLNKILQISHNKNEKDNMNINNIDEKRKEIIIMEINKGLNEEIESSFFDLFSRIFLRTTLAFTFIVILVRAVDDGLSAVLTLYISKIIKSENNELVGNIGKNINLLGLLGPIVSGILIEIPFLGRKSSLFGSIILVIIFFICLYIHLNGFVIWLGLITIFSNASTATVNTYLIETYPTIIRDTAVGYFSCINSIGAAVGGAIFMFSIRLDFNGPFYFQIISTIIQIFFIALLKYETYNKPLDNFEYKSSDEEKND
jgi:MFS family permease